MYRLPTHYAAAPENRVERPKPVRRVYRLRETSSRRSASAEPCPAIVSEYPAAADGDGFIVSEYGLVVSEYGFIAAGYGLIFTGYPAAVSERPAQVGGDGLAADGFPSEDVGDWTVTNVAALFAWTPVS